MLRGCGDEGKSVTSQYFTTLQQMRVWICCIYQCISRVESKGTLRFMYPSKWGVLGDWGEGGLKQKTHWVQNEHFKVNPVTDVMYITKAYLCTRLLQWLFISTWCQNAFLNNSNGHCTFGTRGMGVWGKRLQVAAAATFLFFERKKDFPATYCSEGFN